MSWLIFAFLNAFFEGSKDIIGKFKLNSGVDEYIVAWSFRLLSLPFFLLLLFFIDISTNLPQDFIIALIISGILNIFANIFYFKALKSTDIGLSVPFVTFTPVFLLITSPLILGEIPSKFGIIGILFIFLGSYLLNISKFHEGFFAPFKALLKNKGSRYILLVAFIWSISANYDKMGILSSSPFFWLISVNLFITIFMMPIVFYKSSDKLYQIKENIKGLYLISLVGSLSLISQMIALSMALVPYVISIKRLSTVIALIISYFLFKEKDLKGKLLGVSVMVLGVAIISIF